MSEFRKYLRAFAASRRGNVGIIYALAIIPLALAAGAAVDFARAMTVRATMAEALDAAGLAVGGSPSMSQTDMETLARNYFKANYKENYVSYGTPTDVSVVQSGQNFVLSSSVNVPTLLLHMAGINTLPVSYSVTITRNSKNLEVALALDTTGSMAGTRIADLKTAAADLIDLVVQDAQSPTYSRLALIPYTMAVNVGSYADQVRGPITSAAVITNATWASGAAKTITGATKANPVVITANAHGFSNGDRVVIKSVNGMTQINYSSNNNNYYIVSGVTGQTPNTFKLQDSNGNNVNGSNYSSYSSSGTVTKCLTSACEVVVTANAHGLANGDYVYISGVGGMTQINDQYNPLYSVSGVTTNTYVLSGTKGPSFSAYTSGGSSSCTKIGCPYYRFTSASGTVRVLPISTCVTERSTNAYTDDPPSTTFLGRNYDAASPYASSPNPCITATIMPLTSDKTSLKAAVNNLSAAGSTAGHIGIAWAWYALAQNFGYLWPGDGAAAAYNASNTMKFAVIMTDGAFNTPYCQGVISQDALSGSGSGTDHINCNAPNNSSSGSTTPGSSAYQALQLCSAMKAKGITVYTVGFTVTNDPAAVSLLTSCATDSSHAYFPTTGSDLKNAFRDIAQQITNLRIAQ